MMLTKRPMRWLMSVRHEVAVLTKHSHAQDVFLPVQGSGGAGWLAARGSGRRHCEGTEPAEDAGRCSRKTLALHWQRHQCCS